MEAPFTPVLPVAPTRPSELRRTPRRSADDEQSNDAPLAAPRQRQPWRRVTIAADMIPSSDVGTPSSDHSQPPVIRALNPNHQWFSQELSVLSEEIGTLRGEGVKRAAQYDANSRRLTAQIHELEMKLVSVGSVAEATGHRLELLLHKEAERVNRELQARREPLTAQRQPSAAHSQVVLAAPAPRISELAVPGSARSEAAQRLLESPTAAPGTPATPRPVVFSSPQSPRHVEDLSKLQKRLDEVEVELVHVKSLSYRGETERSAEKSFLQRHLSEARDAINAAEERFARALLEQQGETAESLKRLQRRLEAHVADVMVRSHPGRSMSATAGKVETLVEQPLQAPEGVCPEKYSTYLDEVGSWKDLCLPIKDGLSGTGKGIETPGQKVLEELHRCPHSNRVVRDSQSMKDSARIRLQECGPLKDLDSARIRLQECGPLQDLCLQQDNKKLKLASLGSQTPAQQFREEHVSRIKMEEGAGVQESENGNHQRLRGLKIAMERQKALNEEALKAMDEKVTQCLAAVDNLSGRGSKWENLGDRLQRHVQDLEGTCRRATEEVSGAKLRGLVETACAGLRQELRKQVLEPWKADHEAQAKLALEHQNEKVRKAVEALREDLRQETIEASHENRLELHSRLETFAESLKARCGFAEVESKRVEEYCKESVVKMHEIAQQQLVAGEDLSKRLEQGLKAIGIVAELTRRKVDENAKYLQKDLRESVAFAKSSLEGAIDDKVSEWRAGLATEISKTNSAFRDRMEVLEGALQGRIDLQVQGQRALAAEWANHQAACKLYLRSLWDCWEKGALDRDQAQEKDAAQKLNELRQEMRSEIPVFTAELRAVAACTATSLEQRMGQLEKSVVKACNLCDVSAERVQARVEEETQAVRHLCHEELRALRSSCKIARGGDLGVVKESRLRFEVCNVVAMIAVRELVAKAQQRLINSEVASLRTSLSTQTEIARGRVEAELGGAQAALEAASARMEQQDIKLRDDFAAQIAEATASCFMKAMASNAQIREELEYVWHSETAGLSDRFADLQQEVRMLSQALPRR